MSTKFQTLCRKPCSIQLSISKDMSDYIITETFVAFYNRDVNKPIIVSVIHNKTGIEVFLNSVT